jgi:hypothetical protein
LNCSSGLGVLLLDDAGDDDGWLCPHPSPHQDARAPLCVGRVERIEAVVRIHCREVD